MRELVIDNFAGGGGASLGIERALGRPVDIAINHDPEAIAMHLVNHPDTRHLCENIWQVDPATATMGRPVGLAWFSPDCTHFSKAKGGKPVKKHIRGLAWVVLRWAGLVRPRVIMLENVEEFKTWGPVRKGHPVKKFMGRTFETWKRQLKGLGYVIEHRELVAADYGAPTSRKRLFLIARCDGDPIVWPKPTYGTGCEHPYRTAAECIDWSIPCPSIFDRKKPLAENTMKRISRGIWKYVIDSENPFIVPSFIKRDFGQSVGSDLDEPLLTATESNHSSLVSALLSKYHGLKGNESRCGDVYEPLKTLDTSNRYSLVSAFLSKYYGGVTGQDCRRPIGTITSIDHHSLSVAHLSKLYGTAIGSDVCEPMPTITGQGQHLAEVRAFLLKYYGNEKSGCDLNDPIDTVTGKDRFGLVTISGIDYQIIDICMRMLTPRELARGQGFPDSYILLGTNKLQVAKIGNSVCPAMSEALVKANVKIRNVKIKEAM